jgi:hypothetical protein
MLLAAMLGIPVIWAFRAILDGPLAPDENRLQHLTFCSYAGSQRPLSTGSGVLGIQRFLEANCEKMEAAEQ